MIEEGIQKLVQANAAVLAICPVGGYMLDLLPNAALPNWTWQIIADTPDKHLTGSDGLTETLLQIDVFGQPPDVIRLAKAIDAVLHGYVGTLADSDHTVVQECFRTDKRDFSDNDARNTRRMLEYNIWYNAS